MKKKHKQLHLFFQLNGINRIEYIQILTSIRKDHK